jgi:hypothetical protein
MRPITTVILFAAILLIAGSAQAYLQGKILSYDGTNITYSIYFPDYDRPYNASESPVNVDVRFLIYWEHKNGKEVREEYQTSVETVTNTNANFRYPLQKGLNNIRKATINLYIENQLSDTYIVSFVAAGPEH